MPPTNDPNFPSNLNINPLHLEGTNASADGDAHAQAESISKYGIAGRVWEASGPLLEYLTPENYDKFEPPCSFFAKDRGPVNVLELGSGQALASMHLASHLTPKDTVVLTDLANVVPLCQRSIDVWAEREENKGKAEVITLPLGWGDELAEVGKLLPFTHLLLCDLVYFPHLYPPLLRTLLQATEPEAIPDTDGDTFGPEIIMAWKSRSFNLEESFFDAFARYFSMTPVLGPRQDPEVKLFVCQRWKINGDWSLPDPKHVMSPPRGVVMPARTFGLAEQVFASLEWDD